MVLGFFCGRHLTKEDGNGAGEVYGKDTEEIVSLMSNYSQNDVESLRKKITEESI